MRKRIVKLVFLMLCTVVMLGCNTVPLPDIPYHSICKGRVDCTADLLNSAVSIRNDVYIQRNGWGSCFHKPAIPLKGSKELLKSYVCPDDAPKTRIQTPFQQAWIEYAENGKPHDPWQKVGIVRWIQNHKGPLHVLIYVHGWHNNAEDVENRDPRNNAIKFASMASRHVDTLKRLNITNQIPNPEVLAIYVGWPGEKYSMNPLLSLLSIDSRSKVADKVGHPEGQFRQDLVDIADAATHAIDSQAHIFVMGHSLGGRLLSTAFLPDLAKGNFHPLGLNSLIVTVNAAVGADCYDPVFGPNGVNPTSTRPYWVNLTSENDTATGSTYRYAKLLGMVESCNPKSDAASQTIGHYGPYLQQCLDNARGPSTQVSTTCGRLTEGLASTSELGWFRQPGTLHLNFPYRDGDSLDLQKPDQYLVDFGPQRTSDLTKLTNSIWNVRTDQSLIDFDTGGGGLSGRHNGYITTVPNRLLLEMLYSQ